ncbi:putative 46 kDa FK506-binding nuclear protein-like [Apostichopus japonicus]|uniref:Putative 46 kDa FK506-binding nuclear protein-like n=1 Tax=Stichopus japonicus TaxID=307972 RepID=A0A2G8LFP8_STIJA|nr:putative 46 kDa FK506-binding nuclear protein-like [Apostichopus japonicus]
MYSCVLDEEVHSRWLLLTADQTMMPVGLLSYQLVNARHCSNEVKKGRKLLKAINVLYVGSKYSQVVLKTKDTEQLLCTLVHGTIFQQSLDLKLMPREKVSFSVQGSGVVYITGYSFSSPDGDYIEDEEMPSARRAVEQEARSRVEQEEIITAGVSVNIKDEPHDSIRKIHFRSKSRPPEVGQSLSAPMDEEETTHPVATISEKESDFLEKAGTSSSGWQDSRIPLYGTEEAGVYPQASNSQRTGTNLDDSHGAKRNHNPDEDDSSSDDDLSQKSFAQQHLRPTISSATSWTSGSSLPITELTVVSVPSLSAASSSVCSVPVLHRSPRPLDAVSRPSETLQVGQQMKEFQCSLLSAIADLTSKVDQVECGLLGRVANLEHSVGRFTNAIMKANTSGESSQKVSNGPICFDNLDGSATIGNENCR